MHEWFETPPASICWRGNEPSSIVPWRIFGYHALQLGLPELDTLQANRMPHQWLALSEAQAAASPPGRTSSRSTARALRGEQPGPGGAAAFAELNVDPHATLREVERVLLPEGSW